MKKINCPLPPRGGFKFFFKNEIPEMLRSVGELHTCGPTLSAPLIGGQASVSSLRRHTEPGLPISVSGN